MSERKELLPPGDWVPNDFAQGDRLDIEGVGPVCTVLCHNEKHYGELRLDVTVDGGNGEPVMVWPNLQWMTYHVEEDS